LTNIMGTILFTGSDQINLRTRHFFQFLAGEYA
jgi:hypothetical protein